MGIKVFILGRPGSGKSTAARNLRHIVQKQHWTAAHFNDYDILLAMYLADYEHKYFRPTEHNGFDATDLSVMDRALEQLESKIVQATTQSDVVTIEFARDDYCAALEHFSPSFLQDACLLFLDADLDICLRRVHERVMHSQCTDDHPSFSDDIFKRYYARDNRLFVAHEAQQRFVFGHGVTIIDNSGSLPRFLDQVEQFAYMALINPSRELAARYTPPPM